MNLQRAGEMAPPATLDTSVLREHLGPQGPWAREAGQVIAERCSELRLSAAQLATELGVTATTIKSIIAGQMVPRDYLRAAIAWRLGKDVHDIWRPLRRERIALIAASEAGC